MGAIETPGYLEGGDFFPCGRGLAMLGVGLRSNVEAATQLMQRDLLGTDALAVVRDDFEQSQDRMHLDCVFSLLGDDVCLMLDEMMGEDSPTRCGRRGKIISWRGRSEVEARRKVEKIKTHFRQKKDNTKQQEARRRVPPLRPGPALRSRARRGRVFEIHAGAPRVPHHPHLGRREFFLNFFCQVLLFSLEERERERERERENSLFFPLQHPPTTTTTLLLLHRTNSSTAATSSTWETPRSSPSTQAPPDRSCGTRGSGATCRSSTSRRSRRCTARCTARARSSRGLRRARRCDRCTLFLRRVLFGGAPRGREREK